MSYQYGDPHMRQSGKTTFMCQRIAEALRNDPELHVILTGPHVRRQEGMHLRMLDAAGADTNRVRLITVSSLDIYGRGMGPGRIYCDDFAQLTERSQDMLRSMGAVHGITRLGQMRLPFGDG